MEGEQLHFDFVEDGSEEDAPIISSSDEADADTDEHEPLSNETFDIMIKRKQDAIWKRREE